MFRALMQTSNDTLRHLLSALLPVPYEEIRTCEILNPIILGDAIDEKTCLPSIHIGILGSSPFPEIHKFYSRYELTDIENMHIFTGNFSLRVLDLSQINNVSEKVRSTELYMWAQLFRANTWEKIKMLAKSNKIIQDAAEHLHELTEDEKIRLQCEARFRYECDMTSMRNDDYREGIETGQLLINQLHERLLNDGRLADMRRSIKDPAYQKQLMEEYGIKPLKAE